MDKNSRKVRTHAKLVISWVDVISNLATDKGLLEGDATFSLPDGILLCSFAMVPHSETNVPRWYIRLSVKPDTVLFGEEDEEELDFDHEEAKVFFDQSEDGSTMIFGADSVTLLIGMVYSNLKTG
jgi:hypothetical protein